MRSLLMVCVVVGLALVASAATAGQVPDSTLAQLGLSGMQQISDAQGLAIRGSGFAAVSGSSWAVMWGVGGAQNRYAAASWAPDALAVGADVSVVAKGFGVFTPWGNGGAVYGVVAGGGAIAYAK